MMRVHADDRFRDYVRERGPGLRRVGYLLCGDWHLAEDLVQSALAKIYQAWPRIERRDTIDRYARTVLLRCWLDERRRPWRRAEQRTAELPDQPDTDADPADRNQQLAVRHAILLALDGIPPKQRAAVVLRYFEDLSVAETARVLGCATGTVKSQTARGLAALRGVLALDPESALAAKALR